MLGRPALLKSALTLGVELMKPKFAEKNKKTKKKKTEIEMCKNIVVTFTREWKQQIEKEKNEDFL